MFFHTKTSHTYASHYPRLPSGILTISEALSHHADPHPLPYIKPLTGIVLFLEGRYAVFQHEVIVTEAEGRRSCGFQQMEERLGFRRVVRKSQETHRRVNVTAKCTKSKAPLYYYWCFVALSETGSNTRT